MATAYSTNSGDARRGVSSPRPKGRDVKNTLCRNVTIYGHCRYENTGCAYVHDPSKLASASAQASNENVKQRFNVDSPSFTPFTPATNGTSNSRSTTISPKAANAAPFTPKSQKKHLANSTYQAKEFPQEFVPQTVTPVLSQTLPHAQEFSEFVPQQYDAQMAEHSASAMLTGAFDPFTNPQTMSTLASATNQLSLSQYPPDPTGVQQAGFYPNSGTYGPLLNYHLYASMAPHRDTLKPWQRAAHDFFVPDHLREDLQRKSDASRQILPNSQLPSVDHFHSLVPLDTNNKNVSILGYPSLLYKAVSEKDGKTYALRRIEGYKLTKAEAIESTKQQWKKIDHGGVVRIHDCFTTRAFQDSSSSLIFVIDYHPLSRTLVEQYPTFPQNRYGARQSRPEEAVLWGYIVQLASALKTIHNNKLAARVLHPSKIIVTSKGRIRLSGCGIMDVLAYDPSRNPSDALISDQQQDLVYFGQLILYITNTSPHPKPLDSLGHVYSTRLKDAVTWLLNAANIPTPISPHSDGSPQYQQPHHTIDEFLMHIYSEVTTIMDNAFHAEDTLTSYLALELENGRMFRILAKLGFINERPEYDPGANSNAPPHGPPISQQHSAWSETGDRYYLKLFRDYVFHQVDSEGKPIVDLAHVVSCINKLDAGSEERICLVDRSEGNVFIISYREIKRYVESAFQELVSGGGGRGRR